eukprot:1141499-Prorocentrum_minimum.AAC.2
MSLVTRFRVPRRSSLRRLAVRTNDWGKRTHAALSFFLILLSFLRAARALTPTRTVPLKGMVGHYICVLRNTLCLRQ